MLEGLTGLRKEFINKIKGISYTYKCLHEWQYVPETDEYICRKCGMIRKRTIREKAEPPRWIRRWEADS